MDREEHSRKNGKKKEKNKPEVNCHPFSRRAAPRLTKETRKYRFRGGGTQEIPLDLSVVISS